MQYPMPRLVISDCVGSQLRCYLHYYHYVMVGGVVLAWSTRCHLHYLRKTGRLGAQHDVYARFIDFIKVFLEPFTNA